MIGTYRIQIALLTIACFVCSNTALLAQESRGSKVSVIDIQGDTDPDTTDILYFVEKGVRTSTVPITLVSPDRVLNAGRQQSDEQNIAFGTDSLNAARTHFEAGQYDRSAEHALQASVYFEESHSFLPTTQYYLEALMLQGLSLARTGARKNAVRVLARAFVVEPKLVYDAYPQEKGLFDEAKASALSRDIGSITVVTQPGASRVFVDGRYRGVAPTYRPGLREGLHFVRVERQGFARSGIKIESTAGQDVKVEVVLKPAARSSALTSLLDGITAEIGREDLPATGATMRLKSLLLTDYVILVQSGGPSQARRLTLYLYDLNTGRQVGTVRGTVDWARRDRQAKNMVMSLTQELLDGITASPLNVELVEQAQPASDDGLVTKWWFWTAIGAAVTGLTVGLAVGLQPEKKTGGIPKDGTGGLLLEF